ncbi:MAG: hypothetical protein KDC87_04310 [Planctomycetes bacterium]|nr:hypothetical protein [Planctomycetota bacterium]
MHISKPWIPVALVALSVAGACSTTPDRPAAVGPELADLGRAWSGKRGAEPQSASGAKGRTTDAMLRDRAEPEGSRLATLAVGELTLRRDERPELQRMAGTIAALTPERAVALLLDYGRTPLGLAQAIKILTLMPDRTRASILERLRPAELRAVLDHTVVQEPTAEQPSAPAASSAQKPAPATKKPTPDPAKSPSPAPRIDPAQRFVLAGYGQSAWQTLLDTRTGVIYNYRAVDGRMQWVAITHSLLDTVTPPATPIQPR